MLESAVSSGLDVPLTAYERTSRSSSGSSCSSPSRDADTVNGALEPAIGASQQRVACSSCSV